MLSGGRAAVVVVGFLPWEDANPTVVVPLGILLLGGLAWVLARLVPIDASHRPTPTTTPSGSAEPPPSVPQPRGAPAGGSAAGAPEGPATASAGVGGSR